MTYRKILIFFLFILFHASVVFSMTCDLEGCIEFALEHNPQLRLEKMKELNAAGDYAVHRAEQKTKINWKAELGYLNGRPVSPFSLVAGRTEDARKVINTEGSYYNTGVGIEVPLYKNGTWIGYESPSVDSAKFKIEETKFKYMAAVEDIRHRITGLYYNALKAMEDIKVFELRDKEYKREYKAREARFQLGLIPQSDLLELESQWTTEAHELFQARQSLSLIKSDIAAVLGLEISDEVILQPSKDPLPVRPPLADMLTTALENSPEMKAVQSYIKQAESELDLVRKEKMPLLDFNVSYSLGDDFNPPSHVYWNSFLNTSFTLFDSGLTKAKESSARGKLHEAELMSVQLRTEIILNVNRLYQNVLEVEDRIAYIEKNIVVARQSLTYAQARVEGHLSPESIVHEAEVALAEKEKLLIQARYDWRIAYSELWKEVGSSVLAVRVKD